MLGVESRRMNIKALSQAVADAALKTVADTTNEADLEKNVAAATEALILAEIKKHVADEPLLRDLAAIPTENTAQVHIEAGVFARFQRLMFSLATKHKA